MFYKYCKLYLEPIRLKIELYKVAAKFKNFGPRGNPSNSAPNPPTKRFSLAPTL